MQPQPPQQQPSTGILPAIPIPRLSGPRPAELPRTAGESLAAALSPGLVDPSPAPLLPAPAFAQPGQTPPMFAPPQALFTYTVPLPGYASPFMACPPPFPHGSVPGPWPYGGSFSPHGGWQLAPDPAFDLVPGQPPRSRFEEPWAPGTDTEACLDREEIAVFQRFGALPLARQKRLLTELQQRHYDLPPDTGSPESPSPGRLRSRSRSRESLAERSPETKARSRSRSPPGSLHAPLPASSDDRLRRRHGEIPGSSLRLPTPRATPDLAPAVPQAGRFTAPQEDESWRFRLRGAPETTPALLNHVFVGYLDGLSVSRLLDLRVVRAGSALLIPPRSLIGRVTAVGGDTITFWVRAGKSIRDQFVAVFGKPQRTANRPTYERTTFRIVGVVPKGVALLLTAGDPAGFVEVMRGLVVKAALPEPEPGQGPQPLAAGPGRTPGAAPKRKQPSGGFDGDGHYEILGREGRCRVHKQGRRLIAVFEQEQSWLAPWAQGRGTHGYLYDITEVPQTLRRVAD